MIRLVLPLITIAAATIVLLTPINTSSFNMEKTSTYSTDAIHLNIETRYRTTEYESVLYTYDSNEIQDYTITAKCTRDLTLVSYNEGFKDIATCKPGNTLTWMGIPRYMSIRIDGDDYMIDLNR